MSENHVFIIIPVYNRENLISVCAESVMQQTFSSWTAVFVDDGSTDNTGTILDELAQKDSRLVIIHQENAGIAGARNRGLDEVFARINTNDSNEYIMFLDSDDILEPYAMEHAVATAIKNKADIVQWQANDFVSDDEHPEKITNHNVAESNLGAEMAQSSQISEKAEIVTDSKGALEILLDTKGKGADKRFHLLWNDCRCVWTKLCAAKVYEGVRCPKDKSYEDDFIVDDLFMNAGTIVFINENLTNYRCHNGNFLKSTTLKDRLDHTECERNRFAHAAKFVDSNLIRLAFHNALMSSANSYKMSRQEGYPQKSIWKELGKVTAGHEKDFAKVDKVIFAGFKFAPALMNVIYNQYRKIKD